LRTYAATESK